MAFSRCESLRRIAFSNALFGTTLQSDDFTTFLARLKRQKVNSIYDLIKMISFWSGMLTVHIRTMTRILFLSIVRSRISPLE